MKDINMIKIETAVTWLVIGVIIGYIICLFSSAHRGQESEYINVTLPLYYDNCNSSFYTKDYISEKLFHNDLDIEKFIENYNYYCK